MHIFQIASQVVHNQIATKTFAMSVRGFTLFLEVLLDPIVVNLPHRTSDSVEEHFLDGLGLCRPSHQIFLAVEEHYVLAGRSRLLQTFPYKEISD